MVVGTTPYKDTREAYPLDRKTLRRIALRSFLMKAPINSETGSSVGWTWAISPGLKKIHTDSDDLAVSMGHNLEYSESGTLFCTFVMGVVLAAEAQKADPAVIRSLRTSASLAANSLEHAVMTCLILPGFLAAAASVFSGHPAAVLVMAAVLATAGIVLRFALISYGYARGSAALEKLMSRRDDLTHAARIAGIFMTAAMCVLVGTLPSVLDFQTLAGVSSAFSGISGFSGVTALNRTLPGAVGIAAALLSHHLLVRRNWTLGKCAVLLAAAGFLLGMIL